MEREYQKARENPLFRQEFLDRIDLESYQAYVSRVKYSHQRRHSEMDEGGSMWNEQSNPLGWIFRGFKSVIKVTQAPFLELDNPYDFLNILLHHEGEHARQRFENPKDMTKKRDLMENLAWQNQLRNLDPRCSPRYKHAVWMQVLQKELGLIT